MANTYTEITTESGYSYIELITESGDVFSIPKDESNADYQAYLNPDKVEHLTEIIPADEA